jgi:hypothetical protein
VRAVKLQKVREGPEHRPKYCEHFCNFCYRWETKSESVEKVFVAGLVLAVFRAGAFLLSHDPYELSAKPSAHRFQAGDTLQCRPCELPMDEMTCLQYQERGL